MFPLTGRNSRQIARRGIPRRTLLRRFALFAGMGSLEPSRNALAGAQEADRRELRGQVIRLIVPHAAGGGFDAYARLIEPFFESETGAEVVVDNVAGAGGKLGATRLMRAPADGLTIGLLNAPGLILAAMSTEAGGPNVLDDFTILGRVARTRQIWATGSRSGLRSMDDLFRVAAHRPIVAAVSDAGSTGFANAAIGADLLGIDLEFVAGYSGSGQACLAAVRGEVDVIVNNFESTMALIEAGDLRPLLQVGDTPVAVHPALVHVPLLGGEEGVAVRRARELGSDTEQAKKNASALAAVIGAGRVLAAPRGMDGKLQRRLEGAFHRTLTNPEFVAAAARANRSLDVADGMAARAALEVAVSRTRGFLGALRAAIERIRR